MGIRHLIDGALSAGEAPPSTGSVSDGEEVILAVQRRGDEAAMYVISLGDGELRHELSLWRSVGPGRWDEMINVGSRWGASSGSWSAADLEFPPDGVLRTVSGGTSMDDYMLEAEAGFVAAVGDDLSHPSVKAPEAFVTFVRIREVSAKTSCRAWGRGRDRRGWGRRR